MHSRIVEVTERIRERSRDSRAQYLARIQAAAQGGPKRMNLPCGNLAHGFAACSADDKQTLRETPKANVAIVSAYNDMLSAHQPFEHAPEMIKNAVKEVGRSVWFLVYL